MAVIFYDNFTDTDGTQITAHTPDGGGSWAGYAFGDGNAAKGVILSNRAANNGSTISADNAKIIHSITPTTADYKIVADIYVESLTRQTGLMIRTNTGEYTAYLLFINSDKVITLYRINSAALTSLGTYTFSAMTAGSTYAFEFSAEGSGSTVALVAKVDGTQIIAVNDTSASRITSAGRVALWLGGGTKFNIDSISADYLAESTSVSVTEPANLKVYQRAGTSKSITFSGSYEGTPAKIQAKIVNASDSSIVVDWADVDTTPSTGSWSGALSVPQGGWYNVHVRQYPDTTIVHEGTNNFGVGLVFALAGQSNAMQWFTIGTGTPSSLTSKYTTAWGVNTGSGACAFANAVQSSFSVPVAVIDGGANGAALTADGDRGSGYWLNLSGTPWTVWKNRVTGAGGEIEAVLWLGGESDAMESVSQSVFQEGFATLISRMRDYLADASLPVFFAPLARGTHADCDDTGWNGIQDAFYSFTGVNTSLVCDAWDLDMADTRHYSAAGYAAIAGRFATKVSGGNPRGPYVSGISVNGATVDISVSHINGADIAPASAADGFRFTDDSGVISATVARLDASTFRATLGAAPDGAITVYVAWGANPAKTYPARDDDGYPVQKTLSSGISDFTAPVLTGATATATGPTTATASVSTDDGNGTLYFLASTNATESAATVKAALSQSVTTDGEQSVSLSALDPETTYYVHFVQINGASLESASVVSTSAFTTDAIAVKGATITLHAGTTPQASIADIVALWWDATTPSGAPDYSTTTASTDSSGVLTLDLDATTALSIGDDGFLLLYKLDATDHRDSLVFAGRVAVSDIA